MNRDLVGNVVRRQSGVGRIVGPAHVGLGRRLVPLLAAAFAMALSVSAIAQTPLLPDLQVLTSYMTSWSIAQPSGGIYELRFGVGFANGGQGAFQAFRGATYLDQMQVVMRRTFNNNATFTDAVAGYAPYAPSDTSLRIDHWAAYRLRVRPANQSVGAIVAQRANYASFCIIDVTHNNPALPGSPASAFYTVCGTTQGISVGWASVNGSGLSGQSIDVTGVANGDYWLEVEVDPNNQFPESNESNNIARIAITLTTLPAGGFTITQQPASLVVNSGASAMFAAAVTPAPASSQWYRDGVALANGGGVSGATTNTLTINPATPAHSGTYALRVVSAGGIALNSLPATLTVACPAGQMPTVATQPGNSQVNNGSPASFTVVAGGDAPFTYQWRVSGINLSDGSIVSGANASTLTINPTALSFDGLTFDCVITNCRGSVTTNSATLIIILAGTDPVGPNTFGYLATGDVAEAPPNLAGATALSFANTDDASAAVALGTDTFNFFGTSYTGAASVFASTNGLITFGLGDSNQDNGDLTTLPSAAAIAVLWDDWIIGSGVPQVRYKRIDVNGDAINDWLVIEWNQVYHFGFTTGGATFRAHLRLNTGALPGEILLAFPDVNLGNVYSFGASATVGIKPSGPATSLTRLRWSQDQAVIQSGDAILFTVLHVTSIERLDASPAPAGVVHFKLRFAPVALQVNGLNASDFSFTTTGSIAGAHVTTITPPAAPPWDEYAVAINTGTGTGTLRLNVVDDGSVTHPSWGALVGPYPLGGAGPSNGDFYSGQTYTINAACPADVNGDSIVNVADLLAVITNWGAVGSNPADVNGDAIVNVADLLTVIQTWGACP